MLRACVNACRHFPVSAKVARQESGRVFVPFASNYLYQFVIPAESIFLLYALPQIVLLGQVADSHLRQTRLAYLHEGLELSVVPLLAVSSVNLSGYVLPGRYVSHAVRAQSL